MFKIFWKSLLLSPALLGATLAVAANASSLDANALDSKAKTDALQTNFASLEIAPVEISQSLPSQEENQLLDQVEQYGNEGQINTTDQVTSVNQLRDVDPTSWAFEALRNLVERYGCIVGYPDRTFRGDRAMTRWEFAAGLNACLTKMEELINNGLAVLEEDIATLKRLMDEFQAELAALGARIDNLESRVAFLEDHQFSTTTKLAGEVIFAITDTFGDHGNETQTVFQDRVRLSFNTSFTGQDRLVTRLSAGSAIPFANDYESATFDQDGNQVGVELNGLQSPTLYQTFNLSPSTNNDIFVDWLAYYTTVNLGDFARFNTYIAAFGGIWSDFVATNNPYFEDYDGGNGALSTFASENPIYRIGGGAGLGLSFQLGDFGNILGPTSLTIGYLAPNAFDPTEGNGLFNGDFAALAQLNVNLFDFLSFGATYVHSYHSADCGIFSAGCGSGVVGTSLANFNQGVLSRSLDPSDPGIIDGISPFDFGAKVANSIGVEGAINLGFASLSAFGTYSDVVLLGRGNAEIWSYGAGIAIPDLGKEGNILGIFAGAQPYVGNPSFSDTGVEFNNALPIHVELFYKYQVTDNISVTPGVIWLSNPEQLKRTGNEWIGTLRTTFTF